MFRRIWMIALCLALAAGAAAAERVSYLGPEGTYTEEAAQFWFPAEAALNPRETVNDAIADVLDGDADYAVIPQENTVGGAVVNYVDALIAAEDAFVAGEVVLPISQTLMGLPGATLADIKTVCSHAQGLTQSAAWRSEHLPDAEAVEMASTAAAASYVAETGDATIAAVAAPGAAALYGLEVLAENVQITDANKTRFYVLSRQMAGGRGADPRRVRGHLRGQPHRRHHRRAARSGAGAGGAPRPARGQPAGPVSLCDRGGGCPGHLAGADRSGLRPGGGALRRVLQRRGEGVSPFRRKAFTSSSSRSPSRTPIR